jgi:hypothetical protein
VIDATALKLGGLWVAGVTFTTVCQVNWAYVNADSAAVTTFRHFTSLDRKINNGDIMNLLTWQINLAINSNHRKGQYYCGNAGVDPLCGGTAFYGGYYSVYFAAYTPLRSSCHKSQTPDFTQKIFTN